MYILDKLNMRRFLNESVNYELWLIFAPPPPDNKNQVPPMFVIDFEIGIHEAVLSIWPTSIIRGCNFRLGQAWFRNVGTQFGFI